MSETKAGHIGDSEWPHLRGAIRRSAIALAAARAEYDEQGRYFGPDDAARVAITAALDIEEVARILRRHRLDGRKSWVPRVVCTCGWVGQSTDHEVHVAAALHVALGGDS